MLSNLAHLANVDLALLQVLVAHALDIRRASRIPALIVVFLLLCRRRLSRRRLLRRTLGEAAPATRAPDKDTRRRAWETARAGGRRAQRRPRGRELRSSLSTPEGARRQGHGLRRRRGRDASMTTHQPSSASDARGWRMVERHASRRLGRRPRPTCTTNRRNRVTVASDYEPIRRRGRWEGVQALLRASSFRTDEEKTAQERTDCGDDKRTRQERLVLLMSN